MADDELFGPRVAPSDPGNLGVGAVTATELGAAVAAGRAAYPALRVDTEQFVAHVLDVTRSSARGPSDLCGEGLYLAFACVHQDPAALRLFDGKLSEAAHPVLGRLKFPAHRADELVQRLRIRLTIGSGESKPKLLSYRGVGRLEAWLRAVTANAAYDFLKERGEIERWTSDIDLREAAANDNPELQVLATRYGEVLREALAAAVLQLSDRERALLRFCVIQHLTVDEIGAIYGKHGATAARWLQDARAALSDAVKKEFCLRSGAKHSDFYSLMRSFPSYFDLSIERVLSHGPGATP
ncbi:MAG: hypothetical protein RLZZ450_2735 [Pseudomonadota bacterium]|jgi:RNA polymerase sigma-70 factor (ECF subfamily)